MPGVRVTTATRSGPSAPLRAASGQFFVSGITERGDTVKPVLLRGMADYTRNLGSRVTYGAVYDQAKTFFDEGGQQMWVSRVVGTTPTKGTLTLNDRAGSPVPTVRIDAQNAGAWSAGVTIEVQNSVVANTFRIIVRLGGDIVEDYSNLKTPAEAVTALSASPYVRAVDLGSATVAPNNNPAVLAATVLSTGTDDRGTATTASYVAALDRFVKGLGDGAVAIPGQTGSTIHNGIINHCKANNRIGLLAAARGTLKADLADVANDYDTEYAGLFAPHLVVSDGGTGTRVISPEGAVAAFRAKAHDTVGPWRVPAGKAGQASTVLSLDQDFTAEDSDDLDSNHVSMFRIVAGTVRLYGWRSLSNDAANYAYLKDRDLLNRLVVDAEGRLEEFVFANIDGKGQLLSALHAELVGMVEPIRQAGGLYEKIADDGSIIDPGYKVDTGNNVNTAQTLAQNEIKARVLVRVSPTGALVSLTIVKVGILSGL